MRRITAGLFMSLDGVVEGPGPQDNFERAGWTMPYFTSEIDQIIGASMAGCDALLLGRITYQGFESAFAQQDDDMSAALNNQRKYVVSTTLKKATWKNSELIGENVVATIARLKQQDGMDIAMSGSISLVQTLLANNLIDELGLLVYPVWVGAGRRLFKDAQAVKAFKLLEARTLSSGVVYLRYAPESNA